VLSYFDRKGGAAVLGALGSRSFPVLVGTYGIDTRFGAVAGEAGAVYAPLFPIVRSGFWDGRKLPPDEERKLPPRWAGALPSQAALLASPPATRVAWGTELGRRFRDAMRSAPVPAWQFDEIVSTVAQGRAWRDVVRGALDGVALGRPVLGDTPQRGIVWMARHAFPVVSMPATTELQLFWRSVERASARLAGEEYPDFVGDPGAAARALDAGRRALLAAGPVRRAIGGRYIAGVSPGVELRPGLGGNVNGLSLADLRRWRSAYVAQRAGDGVRGFAVFNFLGRNAAEAGEMLREIERAFS
jgi:hypothetical protein